MDNQHPPGGNATTAGAVERLAMARRIVEEFYDLPSSEVADNCSEIAIALAAIIETQELIAQFIERDVPF